MTRPALLVAVLLAGAASAQAPAPPPGPIAMARAETQAAGRLTVTSTAFAAGGTMAPRYTRYGDNVSPPLAWSGGPAATRRYALIVDDPDARPRMVTHWTIWNLTGTALPEAMPQGGGLTTPLTARQGATSTAVPATGYAGPKPPVGDPPHHYHFQVFALDAPLAAPAGADREALLRAMAGHVVARGELVALYGQATAPNQGP